MKSLFFTACVLALISAWALPASAQTTCPEPNKPAGVASMPHVNMTSKHSPAHGTVVLRLDISDKGELVGHTYLEQSGNADLDMAALQAAHDVRFTPEIINCKPTAGTYLFVVAFPEQ